ncbi:hypothetical protein OUZ56_020044 [Daphnia magna]|uniref:Uncharacterized protein n=1 Tax=Daphnia magna TaxID=35525 RepID=A0ABQ9ZDD0_9CRUS|nr:hypothetical protein OUZ56_020044 [Daphnia magna]
MQLVPSNANSKTPNSVEYRSSDVFHLLQVIAVVVPWLVCRMSSKVKWFSICGELVKALAVLNMGHYLDD